MAGLHTPLSTLHVRPHDRPRMTRGRCGSLLLHRNGLAPSALCRSPGAPDSGRSLRQRARGQVDLTPPSADLHTGPNDLRLRHAWRREIRILHRLADRRVLTFIGKSTTGARRRDGRDRGPESEWLDTTFPAPDGR